MNINFSIEINNSARANLAQSVVDFVKNTQSFATGYTQDNIIFPNETFVALETLLLANGIENVIIKNYSDSLLNTLNFKSFSL